MKINGIIPEKENRLEKRLKELGNRKEKALTVYLMGGDPDIKLSEEILISALDNGADILEIGVPFSDPMADGPVIQKAAIRSLDSKNNTDNIFEMTASLRVKREAPLLLMLYYNTIFRYGTERFIEKASLSGIDALIIPDLPPEESEEIVHLADKKNIIIISFITPTTSEIRMKNILKSARGFIYCVALSGVTGERKEVAPGLSKMVNSARRYTECPLFAGFGISTPEQAKEASMEADGIIVGSAIITELENNLSQKDIIPQIIGAKVASLKEAILKGA